MSLESVKRLSELTGRKRETVVARLVAMQPEPGPRRAKLFDSTKALPIIYGIGGPDNGTLKLSSMEAAASLNVAKEAQVRLDIEIKRKERIPIADIIAADDEVISGVVAIIRQHEGKMLTNTAVGEILAAMRELGAKLTEVQPAPAND